MSGNRNILFVFEKNKFSMRKDRFRTSAKQDTSHLFVSGHFENRSFLPILRSPHRTLHNQIKYVSWSDCNEPNIFLKLGNSSIEICSFGNKFHSRFYERDLIGNRYTQTANELLKRISGRWSKSPIQKSPFTKSPFAKRPTLKRALIIGNQLGLVSVYTSVESDKKVLD